MNPILSKNSSEEIIIEKVYEMVLGDIRSMRYIECKGNIKE